MQLTLLVLGLCAMQAAALLSLQNPCAGCTEEQAIKYQVCTKEFGDPCMEMMKKTVYKKDYLGQNICKGKKEDGKCPKYDVNSDKECPDDWEGEIDFHTEMKWECEEEYEKEEVTVKAGGEAKKKDVHCCTVKNK